MPATPAKLHPTIVAPSAQARGALAAHLLRLDKQSRARRFGAGMGDASLDAYAEGWSPAAAVALLDTQGAWRGVVEIVPLGEGQAELALSIEAPHRGQGWGGRMLEMACAWGRREGLRGFTLSIATHNPEMRALAIKAGAKGLERHQGGWVEGRLDLAVA